MVTHAGGKLTMLASDIVRMCRMPRVVADVCSSRGQMMGEIERSGFASMRVPLPPGNKKKVIAPALMRDDARPTLKYGETLRTCNRHPKPKTTCRYG